MKIPFNKPYMTGDETEFILDSVATGHISGNGKYTKLCQNFFEQNYGIKKALMTTSCTDALEMCALMLNLKEGDEVIVPSYTFVSSALAFVREGAKIVFCDSLLNHPNMDTSLLNTLVSSRTRAIVVVHYAGVAVDMDVVMDIANKNDLVVIEDAAQGIDSYYKGEPLGSIGHLGTFSFHETKNIISGEGGLLTINEDKYVKRSEILWEKGTNRSAFFKGEVNKYGWVDIGSSFLPSELISSFLFAQLLKLDSIQSRRLQIWNLYQESLKELSDIIKLPVEFSYSTNNGHMFYIICNSFEERSNLIEFLKNKSIHSVFHYLCLHKSEFYLKENSTVSLPNSERFERTLLRLPMFYELEDSDILYVCECIKEFFND